MIGINLVNTITKHLNTNKEKEMWQYWPICKGRDRFSNKKSNNKHFSKGQPRNMKILDWNCHGLSNSPTIRALTMLMTQHIPNVVFLLETELFPYEFINKKHLIYRNFLKFHASNFSTYYGCRYGGLVLLIFMPPTVTPPMKLTIFVGQQGLKKP